MTIYTIKNRHGIRELKLLGEKATADYDEAAKFKAELDGFILEEGYEHVNIYNADEARLAFIGSVFLLKHLLWIKASERKQPKDKVTILACANATGCHRIDLLVIGKSKRQSQCQE